MEPNTNPEKTLPSGNGNLTASGGRGNFLALDVFAQRFTQMTAGSKQSWERVLGAAWEKRGPAVVRNRIQRKYGVSVSREEAEDIFQTALLRAFEKKVFADAFGRSPEESQKILFGFVKNVIREWWRNDAIRRHRLQLETLEDERDIPAVPPDMVERFVRCVWAELDEQERLIFKLHYLEDKTQTEIKDKLDISIGTVHNRLKRIRARFYETRESMREEEQWLTIK